MNDLISRSALLKKIAEEYDLNYGEILINPERFYEMVEATPTAYDAEKVVAELESFVKLAEDRWVNGTSKFAYQEHKCWVKAIDIVKRGGVE